MGLTVICPALRRRCDHNCLGASLDLEFADGLCYLVVCRCDAAPCDLIGVAALAYRCLSTSDLDLDSLCTCESYFYVFACLQSSIGLAECCFAACCQCLAVVLLLVTVCHDLEFYRLHCQLADLVFTLRVECIILYCPGKCVVDCCLCNVCDSCIFIRCDRYNVAGRKCSCTCCCLAFDLDCVGLIIAVSDCVLILSMSLSIIRPLAV